MAQRKPRPRVQSPDQLLLVYGEAIGDDKERLFDVYGRSLHEPERIIYPDASSVSKVIDRLAKFKLEGAHIALVDGSFDVPHPNHEWYLRHCRMLAAQQMLLAKGEAVSIDRLREAVESDRVKLVVTVDADMRVSRLKGGDPAKGGVNRPIYPWSARADRLAGYMFQGESGKYHPVIDLVTVEGDEQHKGTPIESSLVFAEYLARQGILDNLVIYGENPDTAEQARAMLITPITIPHGLMYEFNPLTGEDWKSSSIIRRIQGKDSLGGVATRTSKTSLK